ncbi:MAG: NYN domain-containing protein [Oscillatoriaceae cyanobacterium Prado104]|jgi:hypothetical protein|nr:NYN domain-containing protein [Oscillatoriaceae cyanobacterium Prado104]
MAVNHRTTGQQKGHSQPLVSIYIDLQNALSIPELAKMLLEFSRFQGRLIGKKVYYNSLCSNQDSPKNLLKSFGFDCRDVPCPLKNSADNQLIADCLEDIHSNCSPDIVILISGDGDFIKLVRNLQKLNKKVIVFACSGNVKQKLKEVVGNDFHFIEDLHGLIASATQNQTKHTQCQLTYNEAIEYMIAAIETASNKGKRTLFSCIDSLMRNLSPKYQGVSSVCKYRGKTFSRFSDLVESAVKDGKIRLQDEQLFVIEADKISA